MLSFVRRRPWLSTAVACLLIFFVLAFIKVMQIRAAIAFGESFPEPSEAVHVVIAQSSSWQNQVRLPGAVRASRDVELRTETNGVIAEVGFRSGEQVEAGRILLQLDSAEEEARLQAVRADIALAEKDAKRIRGLSDKSAVSRQQRDQITARLAQARAQLATVTEEITNKKVVAPFAGFTGIHTFEAGQFLPSGSRVTRMVGNLDELWIDIALPQQFARLASGTPVLISTSELGQQRLEANLIAVESAVSNSSRTVAARALLKNASSFIKPGSFVEVELPVGEAAEVFRLPSTSIRKDALGDYVFVLNQDAEQKWRAARKPVQVAEIQNGTAIISAGVTDGETIATLGSYKLQDGMWTKIQQTEAAYEPAASPSGSTDGNNLSSEATVAEPSPADATEIPGLAAESEELSPQSTAPEIEGLLPPDQPVTDPVTPKSSTAEVENAQ